MPADAAKLPLNREDMMKAIAEGVRRGIVELGEDHWNDDFPPEILYGAIRYGVKDAIWDIATDATSRPGSALYESIKEGVRAAMKQIHIDGEGQTQ